MSRREKRMPALTTLIDRMLRLAAGLLLSGLLAVVVIGVASRHLGRPVAWSEELAQYLLVWTGFVGWSIATRRRSHIRITVLVDRLPRLARLVVEAATQIAVLGFALALLWHGLPLIPRNWDVEWVSVPLSAGLLYLPIPIAAIAVALQALVALSETLNGKLPGHASADEVTS